MAMTDKEKADCLRKRLQEIYQLTQMSNAEMRDSLQKINKDRAPVALTAVDPGIVGCIGGIAYCALMETEDYT